MTTPAPPDPRVLVPIRLRQSSVDELDAIATANDWSRAQAARSLLALGLKAWKAGQR